MSKTILYDAIVDKRTTGKTVPRILQTNEQIFDSFEKMKSNWEYVDSNVSTSTSGDTEHSFKFQVGILSDFTLETQTDGSAVWDIGHYAMGTAIRQVEIINGGQSLLKYNGDQLQEYLWFWNTKNGSDTRLILKNLMDNGAGNINSSSLFCPILAPGQNGIGGVISQPVNFGLSKDPFELKITIRAGNAISKTNALVISKVRLHYKSWAVQDDLKPLFNKFSMVDFNFASKTDTITQSTDYTLQIQNVFDTSGQKEVVGMFVRLVTNANVNTEFERFVGTQIEQLKLQIENKDVYIHRTTQEAKMLGFAMNGVIPYDATSGGYQYFIPFCNDIQDKYVNKGSSGVSLSKYIPSLVLNTSGSTGTYYLFMTTVNKCTYVIDERGTARIVY